MNRNLLVVLAYDFGLFCALVLWIRLDDSGSGASSLVPVAIGCFAIWTGKGIQKYVAGLSQKQRKLRFSFGVLLYVLLVAMALRWMLQVNNAAAWGIGSMGLLILTALQYASWDGLQDEPRKPQPPSTGVS